MDKRRTLLLSDVVDTLDLSAIIYRMRQAVAEPVLGHIKDTRGFRRFLLRGLEQVRAEFALIALTHNLLKPFPFRSAKSPALA